jgi:hypothetical protein
VSNGRRPTKAERKEQARHDRERIQREMAKRRRRRWIGIALVVVAIVAVGIAGVLVNRSSDLPDPGSLLASAEGAATSAGCSDIQVVEAYGGVQDPSAEDYADQTHLDAGGAMPPLQTYPSVPPTSGPHDPSPLRFGVYTSPPPLSQVLHSLEHGAVAIWYDPAAPPAEIQRLQDFYERTDAAVGASKVIVAPFDYPDQGDAGRLPDGTQMALAAWHRLRTCSSPDLAVAFDFTARLATAPNDAGVDAGIAYEGEAPEPTAQI